MRSALGLVGGGVRGVLLLLELEPLDPFSPALPSITTALTPHPSSGGPAARQAGCHVVGGDRWEHIQ